MPDRGTGDRRLRLSTVLAFGVLSTAVLLLGVSRFKQADASTTEVEIIQKSGLQRSLAERVGEPAAQQLMAPLRQAAEQHAAHMQKRAGWGVAGMLALLLVLGLWVVEPTVRAVRRNARLLRNQGHELQAMWAALPTGVVVQDREGRIVDANRSAERLLGLTMAQLQGRCSLDPSWQAVRDDGSPYPGREHPAMRTLASGQALHNEPMGIRTPDGELRWLVINTEPLTDPQGQVSGVVVCFSDATEGRVLQDKLSYSARTDSLTRLPNRTAVMERLQHALAHAQRHPGYAFAVLFMDFDRFKQVNDTLGHGGGDELLRQIAQRLLHTLRPGDAVARLESQETVAARLGGDEFVVVLEGVSDAASVAQITQRVLQELAEPYLIGCTPVQSSATRSKTVI